MQSKQSAFATAVAFIAIALGITAGVYTAPTPHRAEVSGADSAVAAAEQDEDLDYFSERYGKQEKESEELPAQF